MTVEDIKVMLAILLQEDHKEDQLGIDFEGVEVDDNTLAWMEASGFSNHDKYWVISKQEALDAITETDPERFGKEHWENESQILMDSIKGMMSGSIPGPNPALLEEAPDE